MNVCADMLSCLPHRPSDSNDDNEFEVSMIHSSNIHPKTFAQYDHEITDNQCTKEEFNLPGYDLVAEQAKDKELLQLKEESQRGKASQANSKYIVLYWIMYFTTFQRLT